MTITELYQTMLSEMGPRHWLTAGIAPAETPWEILWGGVLVQNTNWRNVDYALMNLKRATQFEPQALLQLSSADLTALVRPAGFYTRKVPTLQSLARWTAQYEFNLTTLRALPADQLRQELKALPGIGDETADYFSMYVFHNPTIIVDTYLRRLLTWLEQPLPRQYMAAQAQLQQSWQPDLATAWEAHALVVDFGKQVKTTADFKASFLAGQRLAL
ncbi:endonuclease III [Lactobacillus paraplantarum] [Lactiplantibacillus mudanjiangensis]|uniref:endonuclease III domain-containing protein n=1 Tax=Lactiplantibacillus mudanjiangensis TaxID=1296538 RepID=UPI00101425F0|nr:endonuclease III [Lactiplantibacillus mudanjiangensis]VDG33940.1 endonuclease III [Lactobacillus paraplantarum] [Lactiplantibacillus mudanjiangensis]